MPRAAETIALKLTFGAHTVHSHSVCSQHRMEQPPGTVESDQQAVAQASATAGMFKKRNRGANIRKRAEDDEDEQDEGGVVRKQKQVKGEPLAFSTKREDKPDVHLTYEGSKALQSGRDDTVTRINEIDTSADRDAR